MQPNTTYFVVVEGFGPNEGNFELRIEASDLSPVAIDMAGENISCFGERDGQVNLAIQGGTLPYDILWNNGGTTAQVTNLPAGEYSVTVTDGCGNVSESFITLTEPDELVLSTEMGPADAGDNGYILLDIAGGTAPFQYSWSNGKSTRNIGDLIPGEYCVTVTDKHFCTQTICAEVKICTGVAELEGLNKMNLLFGL